MKSSEILSLDGVSEPKSAAKMKDRTGLYLLIMLIACYGYFIYRGPQWNADSRLDLTFALVDQHTITIDAYHENTEDKSYYKGHYYTDKAIGNSLLAAPIYFLLKGSLSPTESEEAYFLIRYILTFLVVSIPSAIFGVLFCSFLIRLCEATLSRTDSRHFPISQLGTSGLKHRVCLFVALGFALGTIAFPYATLFFGHQLASLMLFGSFLIVFNVRIAVDHTTRRQIFLIVTAGFTAGFAVLTEYPALIGFVLLGVYAVFSTARSRRISYRDSVCNLVAFLAGALPPLSLISAYNFIAFGHPLSQGYAYLGGSEVFIAGMSQGFMGITHPTLSALWGITFSPYRGLFFLSPFLILALPGVWLGYRLGWGREILLFSAIVVGFFVMNASYRFWDGGYSLGPRHIVPSLPFLTVPVVFAALKWPRISLAMIFWSILLVTVATATNPLPSPTIANPIFDIVLSEFLVGQVNNNWGMLFGLSGLETLIPLGLVVFVCMTFMLVNLELRIRKKQFRAA